MSIGMIGSIMMFGGNVVPENWLYCNGQLLDLHGQYSDLYNAIGTIYGGDGRNDFGVPDLRGRVAVHASPGGYPDDVYLGQKIGQNDVTIDKLTEIPPHTHSLTHGHAANSVNVGGNVATPGNNLLARASEASAVNYHTGQGETKVPMESDAIAQDATTSDVALGRGNTYPPVAPHDNNQPLLAVHFMICWKGYYPA